MRWLVLSAALVVVLIASIRIMATFKQTVETSRARAHVFDHRSESTSRPNAEPL